MQDFKNVKVWQKSHELALLTYKITADFPREELFGLRNSLRKTAVDIPAFIAGGCSKPNDQEFSRLVSLAMGLASRLEYYALIAEDLQLLSDAAHQALRAVSLRLGRCLRASIGGWQHPIYRSSPARSFSLRRPR